MNYLSLFLLILVVSSGCRKDKPLDPVIHQQDTIQNIVFIEDNDVFYLNYFSGKPVRLTMNSTEEKTDVRISYDGKKVAYLNDHGGLKIISITDSAILTVVESGVKDFNWSADNKTLYYLKGQELFFYGPAMDTPEMSIPDDVSFGGYADFHSVSISEENDIAYTLTWTNWVSENEVYYDFYFVRKSSDGLTNIVVKEQSPVFTSVRYSGNKRDLVLTTSWNYFEYHHYYADFSDEIAFTWDPNIEKPIYNSTGNFILGVKKNPIDPAFNNLVIQNSAGTIIRRNNNLMLSLNISDLDWKGLPE